MPPAAKGTEALAAGAKGYITKPFAVTDVQEVIDENFPAERPIQSVG